MFSVAAPWVSGEDFKDLMLQFNNQCTVLVLVRDQGSGERRGGAARVRGARGRGSAPGNGWRGALHWGTGVGKREEPLGQERAREAALACDMVGCVQGWAAGAAGFGCASAVSRLDRDATLAFWEDIRRVVGLALVAGQLPKQLGGLRLRFAPAHASTSENSACRGAGLLL